MFNHFYEKKDQHRCTLYIGEALGRPKDPGAASGRLKILYDYIYTKINSCHPDSAWQQLTADFLKIYQTLFWLGKIDF